MLCSRHFGFTLVEFVTVLAISAIFISLVVPGYRAIIQNNKVISASNSLAASLNYARMEAIRRSTKVSVCPAANAAYSACGSSAQWAQGWIVFLDANNDDTVNTSSDLVKISEAPGTGTSITSSAGIVSYDAGGFLLSTAPSFVLKAADCTGNNARTVNVSGSGRVSVVYTAC